VACLFEPHLSSRSCPTSAEAFAANALAAKVRAPGKDVEQAGLGQ